MGKYVNFWNRVWIASYDHPGAWMWIGPASPQGYGVQGRALAHRRAYTELVGPIPRGMWVDHKCHVRLCVNPERLRVVTPKQNTENHQGARRDSRSGVRGVYWDAVTGSWRVQVRHDGKQIHVGRFESLEEAGEAAREARNSVFTNNDIDRKGDS